MVENEKRWLVWKALDGKKPPVDRDGKATKDWTDPANWLTRADAEARLDDLNQVQLRADGVGFVLGGGWGGLDLDGCRDPQTGSLDPRAEAVLDLVPQARVEVSPSGLGVKVIGRGARWLELTFGPTVTVRSSDSGYFTVTGVEYRPGSWEEELPLDVIESYFGHRAAEPAKGPKVLPAQVAPGAQNSTIFSEMCALRRRGYSAQEMAAAVWAMVAAGRFPAEAGKQAWSRREVDQIAERVAHRYEPGEDDFTRSAKGAVEPTPQNVKRAFRALGARPRLNRFSQQMTVELDGAVRAMDDEVMRRLWFRCGEELAWTPPRELFHEVARDMACVDDHHPVRDYLDDLTWDGTPRVDTWLVRYAGAEDCDYVRGVGRLLLVAAVRRARQPGCKFDEMLVLESPQGLDKSNMLRRLCPDPEWFSESLVLATDSKVVIERTSGVWIAEAAEMVGSGKDVDRLKSFLSTSVDGPVRLAYAREPIKVPRQFVVVGTTNHGAYLRDMTGNRRFWPVTVGRVDLETLGADRDQLWAEAAHLESGGAPTRLPRELWAAAAEQQEARRVTDPWEETLRQALGDKEGKVLGRAVWDVIGVPVERRTQADNERLGNVMRRLGFVRTIVRDGGEVGNGYVRGAAAYGGRRSLLKDQGGDL